MPSYSPTNVDDGSTSQFILVNNTSRSIMERQGYHGGGFSFQRRNGKIDWKKLAMVDVEQVYRDVDIDILQSNITNVAYCNIENEVDVHRIDPNFLKLFKLAQMLIDYLLHSQEYLQNVITQEDFKSQQINMNQDSLKNEISKNDDTIKTLKREFRNCKKLLSEYQNMMHAGGNTLCKCPYCSKSFMNDDFLRKHIERRHLEGRETSTLGNQTTNTTALDATKALRDELDIINKRLISTEMQLQNEKNTIKDRLKQQQDENSSYIKRLEEKQDEWREVERKGFQEECENYKQLMLDEVKEIQNQKYEAEKELTSLRNSRGGRSMVGRLQDDDSDLHDGVAFSKLKQQVDQQFLDMHRQHQDEINQLEEKFKEREDKFRHSQNEKLNKSRLLIEQYRIALEDQKETENDRPPSELIALTSKLREHDQMLIEHKALMDRLKKDPAKTQQNIQKKILEMFQDSRTLNLLSNAGLSVVILCKAMLGANYARDNTDGETNRLSTRPPASPLRSLSPESSLLLQSKHPSQDGSIPLWVSRNTSGSYRLWRNSSSSKGDWRDLFTLNVLSSPSSEFNKALYIYSAAGSPYWRQYVSASAVPPRSVYRLDYVVYVSAIALIGTIQCHVLDTGSGSVVRSAVSKTTDLDGWKEKGLSFFAFKDGPRTGRRKSVTTPISSFSTQDATDSGDDVSVSSFAATDETKMNLAAEIKKSRENLLDKDDDPMSSLNASSTSQWGSTLLDRGQFLPFPGNSLAIARFNHSHEMVQAQRKEMQDIIEQSLEGRGIDPLNMRMDKKQFISRMDLHANELINMTQKYPNVTENRAELQRQIDAFAAENLPSRRHLSSTPLSSTHEISKPSFHGTVSAIKATVKMSGGADRRFERIDGSGDLSMSGDSLNAFDSRYPNDRSTPAVLSPNPSSKPPVQVVSSPRKDEPLDVSYKAHKPATQDQRRQQFQQKPQGQPAVAKMQTNFMASRDADASAKAQITADNDESDRSSAWDSSPPSETYPTRQVPQHDVLNYDEDSDYSDYENNQNDAKHLQPRVSFSVPIVKGPKGEKVRELAASLEASLSNRSLNKPPAGSIDLHASDPQLTTTNKDAFDDGSDFSLSSLDDGRPSSSKTKPSTSGFNRPVSSFDSRPPPAIPQKDAPRSSVVNFDSDDDFDDSDLDLQHL